MARINWDQSFELGVEVVDNDHRLLVSLINQLDDAISGGFGSDTVDSVLRVLVEYTHSHFAREELLMAHSDYPHTKEHIAQHRRLTDQVTEMLAEAQDTSSGFIVLGNGLDQKLLAFLKAWLTQHILGSDKEIAPYVHGHQLRAEEHLSAVEQLDRPPR